MEDKRRYHRILKHCLNENYLHNIAERGELSLGFLEFFLLFFILRKLKAFFGDWNQSFAIELPELLDAVFINGLAHVEHLESSFSHSLDKSRVFDNFDRFSSNEVDVLLTVLHARNVVGKGGALFAAIMWRIITQELGDLEAVGRVLVDSELDVTAEL